MLVEIVLSALVDEAFGRMEHRIDGIRLSRLAFILLLLGCIWLIKPILDLLKLIEDVLIV